MSDSVGLERDQSMCIAEEFPNDVDDASLRPHQDQGSKPFLLGPAYSTSVH